MSVELLARAWEKPVDSRNARRSGYTASWSSITSMLRGELRAIGASQVIIEMHVTPTDLRNDGWIKSTARPSTPGVRLSFVSKHGKLAYEAGTWSSWEHNVYAIARTLRAQRMIAKDGAVKGDQIYMGFKQLPPGAGSAPINAGEWPNVEAAAEWLYRQVWPSNMSGLVGGSKCLLGSADILRDVYRKAAQQAHPDLGGSTEKMAKVNRAKAYIEGGA